MIHFYLKNYNIQLILRENLENDIDHDIAFINVMTFIKNFC